MPRLLKEVREHLTTTAPTVYGGTIGDLIAGARDEPDQTIIRSVAAPLKPTGTLAVLHGNLAPRGAIIKQTAASKTLMQHRAAPWSSTRSRTWRARIDSDTLDVEADDVLVLRNAGPKGGPGMPEAGYLPIPRKLARQGVKDMVRISDARMSGTAFGTVVLHVTPEAADGGPLAIVRTGDIDRARRARAAARAADRAGRVRPAAWPRCPPTASTARAATSGSTTSTCCRPTTGLDFDFLRDTAK